MKKLLFMLLVCVLCLGCMEDEKKGRKAAPNALNVPQVGSSDGEGYVLVMCFDLSGSFHQHMTKDGKAFDFAVNVIDTYTKGAMDNDDEVIFAQLSATAKPLLWQGTPKQMREDFDSAEAFRKFLIVQSDPSGSRIHDGLADVMDFTMAQPGVATGKKKVVMLILSDLVDTTNSPTAGNRMAASLKRFSRISPALGMYWVDQKIALNWQQSLGTTYGFKNYVVESEVRFNPALPSFP